MGRMVVKSQATTFEPDDVLGDGNPSFQVKGKKKNPEFDKKKVKREGRCIGRGKSEGGRGEKSVS